MKMSDFKIETADAADDYHSQVRCVEDAFQLALHAFRVARSQCHEMPVQDIIDVIEEAQSVFYYNIDEIQEALDDWYAVEDS